MNISFNILLWTRYKNQSSTTLDINYKTKHITCYKLFEIFEAINKIRYVIVHVTKPLFSLGQQQFNYNEIIVKIELILIKNKIVQSLTKNYKPIAKWYHCNNIIPHTQVFVGEYKTLGLLFTHLHHLDETIMKCKCIVKSGRDWEIRKIVLNSLP